MLAIIGGTGLTSLEQLEIIQQETIETPYGAPSSDLSYGNICDKKVVFLARHGFAHNIPPHMVNYRANIWALKNAGVSTIISVNAVGGISAAMAPGVMVLPNQIIDYTYGREHTFFAENLEHVTHIDFTSPYTQEITEALFNIAEKEDIPVVMGATYAATQGPRLETAAEIQRLKRDGCDIVGMTGMPEAALAKELGVKYASCSVVANWGAGISDEEITMEKIEQVLEYGMKKAKNLVSEYIRLY